MTTLDEGETLARIAQTLRADIAPAISDEYPKTQAFMAAVVLQKLGQQLALAQEHGAAAQRDMTELLAGLRTDASAATLPDTVSIAIDAVDARRDKAALCALIEALYAQRASLGEARFASLLAQVRKTLRADLDRQMVYAA